MIKQIGSRSLLIFATIGAFTIPDLRAQESGPEVVPPKEDKGGFVEVVDPLKNKSRGSTKHITVYGTDLRRNKFVSTIGDELVRDLARFLGEKEPEESVFPISLTLYSEGNAKPGVKYSTAVLPIEGGGFKIELVVDIRNGFDKAAIRRGMMQALILERTMRSKPAVNEDTKVNVPRWLSDGLLGAVTWQAEPSNRAVCALLREEPNLYPVKELLSTDEIKLGELGVSKLEIYHVSATALVLALQRQEIGKTALQNLLAEVAVFEGDPEELFRKHFPTMNVGAKGLQKLWSLQVAEMSAARLLDTMTIRDTEQRLSKLLYFTLRGKGGVAKLVSIDDYHVLVGLVAEERLKVINVLRQGITQLSYSAFPGYKPLLAEYLFILTDIGTGNFDTVDERLSKLVEVRKLKLDAGDRVRSVLNWYQISEAKGLSGDFSGYASVIQQIELERSRKADPVVSEYVDQMNDLMQR